MKGSNWSWCVLATLLCATSATAQERVTIWTRGGSNDLWADPLNWSNGVPDAGTVARFVEPDRSTTVVDLGGATRHAARVGASGVLSTFRFLNGTLSTPQVQTHQANVVEATLTTDTPVLRLGGLFTLSGSIVGSMDVEGAARFTGVNPYTGGTTVRGRLIVDGGAIPNSPVHVPSFSWVELAGDVFVRDIHLEGGDINTTSPSSARIDTLRFASGGSGVQVPDGAIVAGAVLRNPGATAHLGPWGNVPRNGRFEVATPPPMVGSGAASDRLPVTPWMVASLPLPRTGADPTREVVFVTYDRTGANNTLRPLDPITEHAASLVAGANVRLTADATLGEDLSVNTLNLTGANLTLNNATLNVSGGGLLMNGRANLRATITGTGALALPATEGIVHAYTDWGGGGSGRSYRIDVPVTGGMLTKDGDAELRLTRANSYSGGTNINHGGIGIEAAGALGNGPVRLNPHTFLHVDYDNAVLNNDLVIPADFAYLRDYGYEGADPELKLPTSSTTTLNGEISGVGTVHVGKGGFLRLAGRGAAVGSYGIYAHNASLLIDGDYASPDAFIGASNSPNNNNQVYGNGTVRGRFFGGNEFSPGSVGVAPGRLTVGNAEFYGMLHFDIAGAEAGQSYDQLAVLDRLFLAQGYASPRLDVRVAPGLVLTPGEQFTIIDNRFSGPVEGTFRDLAEGARLMAAATEMRVSYVGGDGNDVVLTVVPEPVGLVVVSLAGLLLGRRRRSAA